MRNLSILLGSRIGDLNMKRLFIFSKRYEYSIILLELVACLTFGYCCFFRGIRAILSTLMLVLLVNIVMICAYGYWIELNNNEIRLFHFFSLVKCYKINNAQLIWVQDGVYRELVICFNGIFLDRVESYNLTMRVGLKKKNCYISVEANIKKLDRLLPYLDIPVALPYTEEEFRKLTKSAFIEKDYRNIYELISRHNQNIQSSGWNYEHES